MNPIWQEDKQRTFIDNIDNDHVNIILSQPGQNNFIDEITNEVEKLFHNAAIATFPLK